MKKVISLFIAFAMLFCFAACGEENLPGYSQGLTKNGVYDIKIDDVVTLPEYKGLEIPAEEAAVTDEEIQSQLDQLAASHQDTVQITDRAVADGDQVNIDYTGYIDEEQFEGGSALDQLVTAGSSEFIGDFLTQIIGHMPGDSFDVYVTFPEDYPDESLAGKDSRFFVVINYIQEIVIPEMNDTFVKENYSEQYGTNTVSELENYIKENLSKNKALNYIDEYLYANTTFGEIPEVVMNHQKECIRGNYTDMAEGYGIDLETLVSYSGYETIDELLDASTDQITELAKDVLIYQAVAEHEGIKISNNDVADYFEGLTGSRDYSLYKDHYGLPYLKMMVLNDKATNLIYDQAQ